MTNEIKAGSKILALEQAAEIIEALMAYGKIHTVSGVRYPAGTHAEFIEKADVWLWENRKTNSIKPKS